MHLISTKENQRPHRNWEGLVPLQLKNQGSPGSGTANLAKGKKGLQLAETDIKLQKLDTLANINMG